MRALSLSKAVMAHFFNILNLT